MSRRDVSEISPDGGRVVVVSNRLPYTLRRAGDAWKVEKSAGGRITDIKSGWTSACREAGLTDLHFHDLRHEWASRAAGLGVLWHVRRDILGHSPSSMTDHYTHASPEEMERAMELAAGFNGEEASGLDKRLDKIAGQPLLRAGRQAANT